MWLIIVAVAVISTYYLSTKKSKKKKKKQKKPKQQFVDKQTQTESSNDNTQNIPYPEGKMAQINGVIVKSFMNDYQIQLTDHQNNITNSNMKIPKKFVEINTNNEKKEALDIKEEEEEQQKEEKEEETKEAEQTEEVNQNISLNIESALYGPSDTKSIRMSFDIHCYDIKSIQYIDGLICSQYPYLKRNHTFIQSVFNPNIIYYFNAGHYFNYKYNISTKQWDNICVVPQEHELKSPNAFYLNYNKGLIGIICRDETKIRIYNELNDEWSTIEMQVTDKVKSDKTTKDIKIGECTLALDTKNDFYHFVDGNKQHFIYNLNSFELQRISTRVPFSGESDGKLVYNEYTHSLVYFSDFWGDGMKTIKIYDITKKKWYEINPEFTNFDPSDWASRYRHFGVINLNNINKILCVGGIFKGFRDEIESKYIFELDLTAKTWSVLNPDLYILSKPFNIGSLFIEPFVSDHGYYKIHLLDKDWNETGSCSHAIVEIKGNKDDEYKNELYAKPNEIDFVLNTNNNENKEDDIDPFFDDIKNSNGPKIEISTDFRSQGIEILNGNTYNIKSIELLQDEISRHNTEDSCIVQSVHDPDILYFFNGSYKDYKYNIKKRKWQRISEISEEYQVSGCRNKNAFYLDRNKGLIGITGDWNTRNKTDIKIERFIRIYNEFNNEWHYESVAEQKLNLIPDSNDKHKEKHFEIKDGSIALDTKNNIYHIVMFSNHLTFNINTKQWTEIGNPPFSGEKNPCLIYNKYHETLYYVGGFFEKIWRMHCFDINNNKWSTQRLECKNFEPFHERYDHFGVIHLNGMNKILTFGGTMGQKDITYIFELNLISKCWTLLDPKIYRLPKKMNIMHTISQNEGNGVYKVDIFNEKWGGGDSGQYRMRMYIEQNKMDLNEENKRYYQGKYIMPKRIKEERREKKKENDKEEKKKKEEEEVYVHPFEKKSGIVVCGYVHDLFDEIFWRKIDKNILREISMYFCFGLIDFNGIWKISSNEEDKQLYKYDVFENEDIEDLEFVAVQYVGYIHSIKHDIYNNCIKLKNHYSVTTNYKGGFSSGCNKIEEEIDCKQFEEIKKEFGQYRQTKWSENKKELITVLKKKEKQYVVRRYIEDNKYMINVSNGDNEILREYHPTDTEPEDGCLIM